MKNHPATISPNKNGWRERCFHVVFGNDTTAGRTFDVLLLAIISISVGVAAMDSVASLHQRFGRLFYILEWVFTLLFTAEYILRLLIVRRPVRYALSFYGIIDFLAVLPTYLALLFPGLQFLIVLRVLRVLRIFQILHMHQYILEGWTLINALRRSARKILIFLLTILTVVTIFGVVMFLVEGPENGFTSIPAGMYWAVVTVGTVGYGDIAPATPMGRLIASLLILIGYGIIAVPTGIYTAELIGSFRQGHDTRSCRRCSLNGHDPDALHCRKCGSVLSTA
jgi:voltage-gated potassium channel